MGDRTYVNVRALRIHRNLFVDYFGDPEEEEEDGESVLMTWYEVNWGGQPELIEICVSRKVPFYGYHAMGSSYISANFVAFGGKYACVHTDTDNCDHLVRARVEDGKVVVDNDDLEELKRYDRLFNRAVAALRGQVQMELFE